MKLTKRIGIFGISTMLILLIAGCAKVSLEGMLPKIYTHNNEIIYTPKINVENTVDVGEQMFSQVKFSGKLMKVHDLVSRDVKSPKFAPSFAPSMARKYNLDNALYRITEEGYNAKCYSWFCSADTNNDGYLDSWWNVKKPVAYSPLKEKVKYSIEYIYNKGALKYAVLYQGKIGNKLRISFREFSNDMARPAFTQDIEYEIVKNENTIIGFKGLRVEVLEATNLYIKYKVIKPYGGF